MVEPLPQDLLAEPHVVRIPYTVVNEEGRAVHGRQHSARLSTSLAIAELVVTVPTQWASSSFTPPPSSAPMGIAHCLFLYSSPPTLMQWMERYYILNEGQLPDPSILD